MIVQHKAKRLDTEEEIQGFLTKIAGQYHIIREDDENAAYPVDKKTIIPYIAGKGEKELSYEPLFARFEKNCECENIPNLFRFIQYYELAELNYLLDRLIIFVENIDREELEDYECGENVVKLYKLVRSLFDRDL